MKLSAEVYRFAINNILQTTQVYIFVFISRLVHSLSHLLTTASDSYWILNNLGNQIRVREPLSLSLGHVISEICIVSKLMTYLYR